MIATLFWIWIAVTVIFVVLLIYRSTLTMHEDDQLFLDSAEDHMQKEQQDLIAKMDKLKPWLRISGAGSAVLIAIIGGLALYNNITQ